MAGRLVTLGGLALALLGCAPPAVSLAEGAREYVATDYPSVLDRWTRTESLFLFDELTRALTVTATYESWDFRWAYVIRYARDYRLSIPERQDLLRDKTAETRDRHEFFVALYGSEQKYDDLTRTDSAWVVRLIDSTGSEIAPKRVEAIRRPDVLERRYYPYNSTWRKAFRISFPSVAPDGRPTIAPRARWFGLRFAGAWGNTDVVWQLAREKS